MHSPRIKIFAKGQLTLITFMVSNEIIYVLSWRFVIFLIPCSTKNLIANRQQILVEICYQASLYCHRLLTIHNLWYCRIVTSIIALRGPRYFIKALNCCKCFVEMLLKTIFGEWFGKPLPHFLSSALNGGLSVANNQYISQILFKKV